MREQQRSLSLFEKAFTHTSPRYEITDTGDKFQVSVDVPGVKSEDIHVNYEMNHSVLSIRGSRAKTSEDESSSYSSQFSLSFSVDPTVDVAKFTANLHNGVLVLSAPKDLKRIEENIRQIPVVVAADAESPIEITDTAAEGEAKSKEIEKNEEVEMAK